MTLKHVLKLFCKTEVQEDKTHPNPPLESEGASKTVAQDGKPYPYHLSQTILNRLFGRVLEKEGVSISCAEHTEKNLSSNRPIVLTTLKKAAFTLAEVLITLGIIGVVAALTLPTLIANHQKQTLVNQLKKAVNTIENAARMAVADEGVSSFKDTLLYCTLSDAYNCPLGGSSGIAQNTPAVVNKYFKTISVEVNDNLRPDINSIYKYINGNNYFVYGRKMVLNDGTFLFLWPGKFFYIDVNGDKGPNIYGRDLFYLVLDTNGKVIDSSNDYVSSNCSTFLDNGGDVVEQNKCFYYKIVSDGWKMNY